MKDFLSHINAGTTFFQLIRYGMVGVVINIAGYLMYLLITYYGGEPKLTMSALYIVVLVAGFLLNRELTFAHKGSMSRSFFRYLLVYGIGYLINLAFLMVLADTMGYPHQIVQLAAMAFLVLYFFIALKWYAFRH